MTNPRSEILDLPPRPPRQPINPADYERRSLIAVGWFVIMISGVLVWVALWSGLLFAGRALLLSP